MKMNPSDSVINAHLDKEECGGVSAHQANLRKKDVHQTLYGCRVLFL